MPTLVPEALARRYARDSGFGGFVVLMFGFDVWLFALRVLRLLIGWLLD
jgi:hypothetical protein